MTSSATLTKSDTFIPGTLRGKANFANDYESHFGFGTLEGVNLTVGTKPVDVALNLISEVSDGIATLKLSGVRGVNGGSTAALVSDWTTAVDCYYTAWGKR